MKTIPEILHSPAPWRNLGHHIMREHDISIGNKYGFIRIEEGVADPMNGGEIGQKANADLVVIAPAMYEALKKIHQLANSMQAEPGSLADQISALAYHAFDDIRDPEVENPND